VKLWIVLFLEVCGQLRDRRLHVPRRWQSWDFYVDEVARAVLRQLVH
jgi:hypothetical protein